MNELLKILEKDARTTPKEIAAMTGKTIVAVNKEIKKHEKEGVIVKYKAIINKELVNQESSEVRAIIEVNIVPQKNVGFDYMAERIYKYPEVVSCYLLSGTYDLLLIVKGKGLNAVASFVAEKLSSMDNVRGTTTHFLLKKYKEDGDILKHPGKDRRVAITY